MFTFKACQCNRLKRFNEYNSNKTEIEANKLNHSIDSLTHEIDYLELEISKKDTLINNYKAQLNMLSTYNKHYMDANKELIKIQRLNKIDQ
jgi:hypothetical protein